MGHLRRNWCKEFTDRIRYREGARRAGYVIEWNRGELARSALNLHNPDICLPLAGSKLVNTLPVVRVRVGALDLPFFCHEFANSQEHVLVYFLGWNLTTGTPLPATAFQEDATLLTLHARWQEVADRHDRYAVRMMAVAV